MRLLKAFLLFTLLGLPLMGSDCGGTTKLNCEAQKDALDCKASGECKWRTASEVKILETQKCETDLPKVDPGTRTTPPGDVAIEDNRKACTDKGGTYVEYVASTLGQFGLYGYPTYADCTPPGPCFVMNSGADDKFGKNQKKCNEKKYCKYVPAKITPAVAKCVDVSDTSLDCEGKTTEEECSGLAIVIGEETKPLCKFKQTEPAGVKEPAKCTVKAPQEKCPEVPTTTVSGNKDDCEATEGCEYTISGTYYSSASCKKHSCSEPSASIIPKEIKDYEDKCKKIVQFCDYQAPEITAEVGVCSDVIASK